MKKLLVLLLLSGCTHTTPFYCAPGYVPARHKTTHERACFLGSWDKVPPAWEPMPQVEVR